LANLSTAFLPIDVIEGIQQDNNIKNEIRQQDAYLVEIDYSTYDGWNKQAEFDSFFDIDKLLELVAGKKPKKRDNEERSCPIRSNFDKIRNFINDIRDSKDFLELTLKHPDVYYRQNELRRFLLMRAYVWNLTKFKSLDEMGKLLEGTKISNDHFKHCIVPSYALHAILLVVMEPLISVKDEDTSAELQEFFKSYHKVFREEWVDKLQRNCDPTNDAGGWFAQFRALQLMRTFLHLLPPKTNRQIICTTVTILSQPPGSQGVSHGSWKSAALTRAHILFDKEAYNEDFTASNHLKSCTTDDKDQKEILSPNKKQKNNKKYFTEKYTDLPVIKKLGVLEKERQHISPLLEDKEAAETVVALGNFLKNPKCLKCNYTIASKFHCTNPACGDITSEVDNMEETFLGEMLTYSQETCATAATVESFQVKAEKVESVEYKEYFCSSQPTEDIIFESQNSQDE